MEEEEEEGETKEGNKRFFVGGRTSEFGCRKEAVGAIGRLDRVEEGEGEGVELKRIFGFFIRVED